MPNDLDTIMSLDPLDLTTEDIDAIILYHRNRRAKLAEGGKSARPKKDKGPSVEIDLVKLGLKKLDQPLARRKL